MASPSPLLALDFTTGGYRPEHPDFRPERAAEPLVLAMDARRSYRVLAGRVGRRRAYLLDLPGRPAEVHDLRTLAMALIAAELEVAEEARSRRAKQWQARQSRRVWMGGGR